MDFEESYDVMVAGGGVAGVAAALASSRAGMKTALIEKTILAGGLATGGLINIYLPLCDGRGTQVTFGIPEELLRLSIRYGPGDVPEGWCRADGGGRYEAVFSPASFALALDEALEEAGVELLLGTLVTRPVVNGGSVAGVVVENASGRGVVRAGVVVDATGDALVAHRAGCECAESGNWLSMWALQASLARAREAVGRERGDLLLDVVRLGAEADGTGAASSPRTLGTNASDSTRFALDGRRLLREYYRRRHAGENVSRHDLFPVTLPVLPQFRTTRRIVGLASLSDGQHGRRFEDSVGLIADWRKPGFVWEVPHGTLVPRGVKGLLVAGRCISSGGDAWEVTRAIPGCALTGEAAGLAASICVRESVSPDTLDPRRIQRELERGGMPYHLDQVGL